MTEGLQHRFAYHPPKDDSVKARHEGRAVFGGLGAGAAKCGPFPVLFQRSFPTCIVNNRTIRVHRVPM